MNPFQFSDAYTAATTNAEGTAPSATFPQSSWNGINVTHLSEYNKPLISSSLKRPASQPLSLLPSKKPHLTSIVDDLGKHAFQPFSSSAVPHELNLSAQLSYVQSPAHHNYMASRNDSAPESTSENFNLLTNEEFFAAYTCSTFQQNTFLDNVPVVNQIAVNNDLESNPEQPFQNQFSTQMLLHHIQELEIINRQQNEQHCAMLASVMEKIANYDKLLEISSLALVTASTQLQESVNKNAQEPKENPEIDDLNKKLKATELRLQKTQQLLSSSNNESNLFRKKWTKKKRSLSALKIKYSELKTSYASLETEHKKINNDFTLLMVDHIKWVEAVTKHLESTSK